MKARASTACDATFTISGNPLRLRKIFATFNDANQAADCYREACKHVVSAVLRTPHAQRQLLNGWFLSDVSGCSEKLFQSFRFCFLLVALQCRAIVLVLGSAFLGTRSHAGSCYLTVHQPSALSIGLLGDSDKWPAQSRLRPALIRSGFQSIVDHRYTAGQVPS